ncbi:MAG: hypothetical protein A2407_03070 [Candidatus Moranbacteria bacterium RIFOXYC1_FULL_44_8]|nr:MAG: hypothetical protein A2194_04900 [Candidatus Moranbacteria bacterium RIFOXYA1_FULL_44_8]OGI34719.1 MAG: hypothetical protein A2407_03070 [Candidatus Moranbacteria bacterium RIFOXYC1_FULL_44_8]
MENKKPSLGKASKFLRLKAGRIASLRFPYLDRLEGKKIFPLWVGVLGWSNKPNSQRLPAFAPK